MERSGESLCGLVRSHSGTNSTSARGVSRFSILCGFVTLDVYWLYLSFFSHLMNPLSVFVVDAQTGLHLQSGQIGNLAVTVAWSEVRLALLLSLLVFVLATFVAEAGGKMLADSGRVGRGRLALASKSAG